MNESQQIYNFPINNTSFLGHRAASACIILLYFQMHFPFDPLNQLVRSFNLYLTGQKARFFSFIHSASTCFVSGPVLSTGDTELGKTWSLPLMEEMDEKAAVSVQLVSAVRHACAGPEGPNRRTGQPQCCDCLIQSLPNCSLLFFPCLVCSTLL